MSDHIIRLLTLACNAYDEGTPIMTDEEFDYLADKYNYDGFGGETLGKKGKHEYRMHSLKKVFDKELAPYELEKEIESPKLDGTAISTLYKEGFLVQALRRGRDGIEGEDVTDKMSLLVPMQVERTETHQINGEVVCDKSINNARNYASGSFGLKSLEEFTTRIDHLKFVAYGVIPYLADTYEADMALLHSVGFATVLTKDISENYRTDGRVYRENDNELFAEAGYTSKHPRGAYARKQSSEVSVERTVLRDVIWQVGRSGKVSPVAIFDEVTIDDAKITRATLHNPGFIEEMQLAINDGILVTRSGGIIPKVLGKV